jgi:uncharacterized membrane protein YtjA (UPF0391 family)
MPRWSGGDRSDNNPRNLTGATAALTAHDSGIIARAAIHPGESAPCRDPLTHAMTTGSGILLESGARTRGRRGLVSRRLPAFHTAEPAVSAVCTHTFSVGWRGDCVEISPTFGSPLRRIDMVGWALMFLVIAIIAGVFGFSGIAGTATQIAWILFVVGLILALLFFLVGRRPPI